MKIKLYIATILVAICSPLFSQKQLELLSQIDYVSLGNDVWGYTAPDGTEYALAGLRGGVSVVSLADPANPVEIQYIPGDQSTWRDLKTWGHYAYVTTDQSGSNEGVLVIDLSGLPAGVTWENWLPVLPGTNDTLRTCHNLWIDEFGYCYLSGCDKNQGGVIILDVFTTPGTPQFVAFNAPVYAHDCFAQNNLLYTADIYEGQFSVYDVTDKQAPQLLASQPTPFEFCHNVWASADGKTLFTTDERANAPTAAFDISDLDNIRLLDEFRPLATLGTGVIPHNAHVLGNYVVISNYTDGCVIMDATHPNNLIEVESYDTSPDFLDGFHGCWGAYPYFPSGLIAAMDIENGLFILKPSYPKAAYLEGKIRDKSTGAFIGNVKVSIQSDDANAATSNFNGEYKTGQASAGIFDVLFEVKGYYDLTINDMPLVAGEVAELNVQMEPLPVNELRGRVTERGTGLKLDGVQVLVENEDFRYTTETDLGGVFVLPEVVEGDYTIYLGKWGYENHDALLESDNSLIVVFELSKAYEDDFNHDLGWQADSTADNGLWERGKPQGVRAANKQFAPEGDAAGDAGNSGYVTGNQGVFVFDDQVDNGEARLTSPPMQLRSRYNRPMLRFDYWWYDAISNNAANDSLSISISNGIESKLLAVFATDSANVQQWASSDTFELAQLLALTDDTRLVLTASDRSGTPNVVEAGLDNFKVWDALPDSLLTIRDDIANFRIYPNPSADHVVVEYRVNQTYDNLYLIMVNNLGQIVREIRLSGPVGNVFMDLNDIVAAPYYISFRLDGKLSKAGKLVKGVD